MKVMTFWHWVFAIFLGTLSGVGGVYGFIYWRLWLWLNGYTTGVTPENYNLIWWTFLGCVLILLIEGGLIAKALLDIRKTLGILCQPS